MKMKFKDAPYHTLLKVVERMGEEIRETFYVRREQDEILSHFHYQMIKRDGLSARLGRFLPAYGIACVQGLVWRS